MEFDLENPKPEQMRALIAMALKSADQLRAEGKREALNEIAGLLWADEVAEVVAESTIHARIVHLNQVRQRYLRLKDHNQDTPLNELRHEVEKLKSFVVQLDGVITDHRNKGPRLAHEKDVESMYHQPKLPGSWEPKSPKW